MNHDLSNSQFIPPQIWILATSLGHMQAVKAEFTNIWVDLSIANIEATLSLFVYERRQFLKGKRK